MSDLVPAVRSVLAATPARWASLALVDDGLLVGMPRPTVRMSGIVEAPSDGSE